MTGSIFDLDHTEEQEKERKNVFEIDYSEEVLNNLFPNNNTSPVWAKIWRYFRNIYKVIRKLWKITAFLWKENKELHAKVAADEEEILELRRIVLDLYERVRYLENDSY